MSHALVKRVVGQNFRLFSSVDQAFDAPVTIFYGSNGSGKTSMLEMLSFVGFGASLRGACAQEVQRASQDIAGQSNDGTHRDDSSAAQHDERFLTSFDQPWALSIHLRAKSHEDLDRKFIVRRQSLHTNHKQCMLDGTAISFIDVMQYVRMLVLTPESDRQVFGSAAGARKFFDRLTVLLYPEAASYYMQYHHAMQERLTLLKEGCYDPSWLEILENRAAATSMPIYSYRLQMADFINSLPQDPLWPQLQVELEEKTSCSMSQDRLAAALRSARTSDAKAKRSTVGPHRTTVMFREQISCLMSKMCSTGEQRAMLLGLYYRLALHFGQKVPLIWILDDMMAYLDAMRRGYFFDLLKYLHHAHIFFSGVEKDLFTPLQSCGEFFFMKHGMISNQ